MDSRDEPLPPYQPLLSSLVVRPSDNGGPSAGGGSGSGVGRRADYEPREVRLGAATYSRSERFSDENGYRSRALSGSPVHRRDVRRYSPDFNNPGDLRRHEFPSGRDAVRSPGRHRDPSPPHYRRGVGRPFERAFEGSGLGSGPLRGEPMQRNNPNVRPREGDWYCPDPWCGNLNFARRESCNSCGRYRYSPAGSPRRGHADPHSLGAPRRFPGPPTERTPVRLANGFRSPPRGWLRNGPREFGPSGMPPPRYESRFPDHRARRDRLDYPDEDFRGRGKFDRLASQDWASRDRTKDHFIDDRKGYERCPPSPLPPPPHRGRWIERDSRERSRSPIGAGPPKDFHRDLYVERGRDERRSGGRDRIGSVY
ncbi:hypothetical protein Dimus_003267 [Dionaea muscipula]